MRIIGSCFVVRGLATAAAVALSPTAGAQTWALERDAANAYLDGVAMADLGLAGPEYSYVTVQHAVAVAVELADRHSPCRQAWVRKSWVELDRPSKHGE